MLFFRTLGGKIYFSLFDVAQIYGDHIFWTEN